MRNILLIIALAIATRFAFAEAIPGQFLLESFQATCSSQGNWTKLALSDSKALIATLENIRDDEDCKSISGAISQLTLLESQLGSLDSDYANQVEIAKLEGQEIELMSQISNVQDPGVISDLEDSLRTIQLEKAGLISIDDKNALYNPSNLQGIYAGILASTNSAYQTIASNQLCLEGNPGILPAATALAGTVAGAAAYVNPALGIGIAAATQFVGETVNYFRSRGYNGRIRQIANGSTVREGFKCALESLSNRWCQIRDAEKFLQLEATLKRDKVIQSELSLINEINDIDMPVLLEWLDKVKAGAPASNSADHQRRTTVIYREAAIRVARSRGEGLFSENRALYDNSSSNEGKYSVIKSIINSFLNSLNNSGPSGGPLTEVYSTSFVPYYLLGLNDPVTNSNGDVKNFDDFDPFKEWPNGTYQPSYQTLINRYNAWVERASARVTQEYNIVFQPDPTQILAIYSEKSSSIYKRSPAEAVANIIAFIIAHKPDLIEGSVFDELYKTTIEELTTIDKAALNIDKDIESLCNQSIEPAKTEQMDFFEEPQPSASLDNCDDQRKKLEIIFKAARLEFGPIFFKNRLETILRVAINEYIENAQGDNSNQVAQLLAADSYLEVLSKVSGTDNIIDIKEDLAGAKTVTLNNMTSFGEVFGRYINNLMFKNQKMINHKFPTIAETYKRDRAELCFLLASMPEWPRRIKQSYCIGMQLTSGFENGPETPVIDHEYLNQNFKSRACEYTDFIRNSKIYEDWGIKL